MLPSLVVIAQRRFCLAAGTRLPEPCGVCMVADPAPRSQWQSIRRLWLRIRGYSPLVAAPCRWCTAGQHRYLGRCCGSGGYGHYCLRLGNRCIKARAIRRQCKKPGVKPGFCIGGGSVVLEAWRHLPTREMPPCVRMHAYMLSPVLMR